MRGEQPPGLSNIKPGLSCAKTGRQATIDRKRSIDTGRDIGVAKIVKGHERCNSGLLFASK
jgi:hypothetical protein